MLKSHMSDTPKDTVKGHTKPNPYLITPGASSRLLPNPGALSCLVVVLGSRRSRWAGGGEGPQGVLRFLALISKPRRVYNSPRGDKTF